MVPAEHGVNSLLELDGIGFVDTAGIDPKEAQVIASSPFSAEPDLAIASFALAGTINQISEGDLLCIRAPCVRKYGVLRNVVAEVLG